MKQPLPNRDNRKLSNWLHSRAGILTLLVIGLVLLGIVYLQAAALGLNPKQLMMSSAALAKRLYLKGDAQFTGQVQIGQVDELPINATDILGPGAMIYKRIDTATGKQGLYIWNGSKWLAAGGQAGLWSRTPSDPNNIYNTDMGRVGVGTNNPGAKLHVAGDLIVDGCFTSSELAWTKIATLPYLAFDVSFISPQKGFVGTQGKDGCSGCFTTAGLKAFQFTADGGYAWNPVPPGGRLINPSPNDYYQTIFRVAFPTSEAGRVGWVLVGGYSSWVPLAYGPVIGIFRSTDYGQSWQQVNVPAAFNGFNWVETSLVKPNGFFALNERVAWIALGQGSTQIYRTTDGGVTWNVIHKAENYWARTGALFFLDENNGYRTTPYQAKPSRTSDGGKTWTGAPVTGNAISCWDENHCVAVGDGGAVFYTVDGGTTWKTGNSATTSDLHGVEMVGEQLVWAAGNNGTFVVSPDGGKSWHKKNVTDDPQNIVALDMIGAFNGWAVGSGGGVFHIGPDVKKSLFSNCL